MMEIMPQSSVQDVQITNRKLILNTTLRLRKKKLSYQKIGDILSMSKSEVYMILKGQWYPKMPEVEQRILESIRGLES